MLSLENVRVRYGGLAALSDVSFHVEAGEFVTIVGPNGAGKTTLLKAISGVVPLAGGKVSLRWTGPRRIEASERPHLGIAHVPENRQVFPGLTVLENLELGSIPIADATRRKANIEHALDLFPDPARTCRRNWLVRLSGGQQQMLAIGRALVSSPKLLLLDEPSMGLAPTIVDTIFKQISQIHKQSGLTVVLVEQRAVDALKLCDRAYVLSTGRMVTSGDGRELLNNDKVRQAYFGTAD